MPGEPLVLHKIRGWLYLNAVDTTEDAQIIETALIMLPSIRITQRGNLPWLEDQVLEDDDWRNVSYVDVNFDMYDEAVPKFLSMLLFTDRLRARLILSNVPESLRDMLTPVSMPTP